MTPLLILYGLFLSALFWGLAACCAPARAGDLNSAFVAVFGKSAPLERHVEQGAPVAASAQGNDVTLSLAPQFLVPLGGARYALIVSETTASMRAGSAPNNAVSVAYLSQIDGAWAVQQVWFEVGDLGFAGNGKTEVKNFGADPLYFSTTGWCGMDSCSDTINVLVLEATGPMVMGEIKGGAAYPQPDETPNPAASFCESTDYTAVIGPPSSNSGPFSVTYEGWTAPIGKLLPKRHFRRTADVVAKNGTLVTGLQTPDCMR
jgi:hypothetical protein